MAAQRSLAEDIATEEVIHAYTRAEALADGVLIDVTRVAREAGFAVSVAVTRRVWAEVVEPPEDTRKYGQSENGRLWDIFMMLRIAIANAGGEKDRIEFSTRQIMADSSGEARFDHPSLVPLWAHIGPGDEGEPVVTIMMIDED